MSHRRVIRIISYEGNDDWVDEMLRRSPLNNRLKTLFRKQGTVSELSRIELAEGEAFAVVDAVKRESVKTP